MNFIEQTYNNDALNWYSILAQLQTNDYEKIILLYKDFVPEQVIIELRQFDKQELLLLHDESLNEQEIKIILEKK